MVAHIIGSQSMPSMPNPGHVWCYSMFTTALEVGASHAHLADAEEGSRSWRMAGSSVFLSPHCLNCQPQSHLLTGCSAPCCMLSTHRGGTSQAYP